MDSSCAGEENLFWPWPSTPGLLCLEEGCAALKMLVGLGCCGQSGAGRSLSKTVLSESYPKSCFAIVCLAIEIWSLSGMDSFSSRKQHFLSVVVPAQFISHIYFLLPSHLCVWSPLSENN